MNGPANEITTLVDFARETKAPKSSESALMISGDFLSGLSCFSSSTVAESFEWERPPTAHFKSTAQCSTMYLQASFPVYPTSVDSNENYQ